MTLNHKYNAKSWNFDLTAKRIIAWLSSHNLTYEDGIGQYKIDFNTMVQKQANHLINEIWDNKEITKKNLRKLNNFYWLFSLDLKSSKKNTQSVIKNWMTLNHKYNAKSWNFDLTA